jgi:hypothetical protein
MLVPPMIRHHRALTALAALAALGLAAVLIAPDSVFRALPFLVLLACPLMMVFMMRPMHHMPAAGSSHRGDDPYSRDALAQRLAELDAERVAITELLAVPPSDRPAGPQSGASFGTAAAAPARRP